MIKKGDRVKVKDSIEREPYHCKCGFNMLQLKEEEIFLGCTVIIDEVFPIIKNISKVICHGCGNVTDITSIITGVNYIYSIYCPTDYMENIKQEMIGKFPHFTGDDSYRPAVFFLDNEIEKI